MRGLVAGDNETVSSQHVCAKLREGRWTCMDDPKRLSMYSFITMPSIVRPSKIAYKPVIKPSTFACREENICSVCCWANKKSTLKNVLGDLFSMFFGLLYHNFRLVFNANCCLLKHFFLQGWWKMTPRGI